MSSNEVLTSRASSPRFANPMTALFRGAVVRTLAKLRQGHIALRDGDRTQHFGAATHDCPLEATITVHSPRFYGDVALGGGLGAGESYVAGHWSCDDLTALIRIMARNADLLGTLNGGIARLRAPLARLRHRLARNTREGSRRNIHAHYDLGNEFFRLFLDKTMTYSCALFESEEMTLEQASLAKIDRICERLGLGPDVHVLEIGTGWGSFAIRAAGRWGCRVTTTTISEEQHRLAVDRVRRAGLEDRVTVLLADYRDLEGQFDRVVSIEMIEAVGHEYLGDYFEVISRALRPDGMALIQAITMRDQEWDRYRRSADFIQRHVFPGSCLPSVSAMMGAVTDRTDMALHHFEDMTPHYVTTLMRWRDRFWVAADAVRAQGFPDEFMRMWDYYLCYCAGGFAERRIGVAQLTFAKPGCRT